MANTLLTNDIIAPEALVEFKNNLILARMCDRQYQNVFTNRTGTSIDIFKPVRYTVRNGATINIQDITQRVVPLTIDFQDGVDIALTSAQLALDLDSFSETVLRPAMRQLANQVDMRLYNLTSQIYNAVGTPGTAPNSFASLNNVAAVLNRFGVDTKDRYALFSSDDGAALQNGAQNYFNESFNKSIIFDGSMGRMAGFDVANVQHTIRPEVSSLAVGSRGTPLVNGAGQTGSTLNTNGWANSITDILYQGATFTIAGVYSVNPLSRNSTGQLQTFTVTADANSGASTGPAALSISPSIITSGPYQTVTNSPADDAPLTVNERHTINFGFNKEAFTLAMVNLPCGGYGVWQKNMIDADAGVSIRMSRQFDISNDKDICRFDIFYGVGIFPEYACRLMGS